MMMTTALATNGHAAPLSFGFSPDMVELFKRTYCKGVTNDELALFLATAERTGLSPLHRQLFAVKRWDSREKREIMTVQVSIDGFRVIAERSGKYAGQLGPLWCGRDGQWREVWFDAEPPAAAKVAVLRSDFREPLWSVATWDQYKQTKANGELSPMWAKMPALMLGKVAESLSLRRAFPAEMSGLYTDVEMAQAVIAAPEPTTDPAAVILDVTRPDALPPALPAPDAAPDAAPEAPGLPDDFGAPEPAEPADADDPAEIASWSILIGETNDFAKLVTLANRAGKELKDNKFHAAGALRIAAGRMVDLIPETVPAGDIPRYIKALQGIAAKLDPRGGLCAVSVSQRDAHAEAVADVQRELDRLENLQPPADAPLAE